MIPWLTEANDFPHVESALRSPNGLLAAGGDLQPGRLLAAYRKGIFPWYSAPDPILWWSPDPRMVLFPDELRVSRSLRKSCRNLAYSIRFDTSFCDVLDACAETRKGQPGTWIGQAMREAYVCLHRLGYAHSVETWMDGELAGGLYGVSLGKVFFGESMFFRQRDASKLALVGLCALLQEKGFRMIDCQMHTPHLASLGGREIPRLQFSALLEELVDCPLNPELWTKYSREHQPGPRPDVETQ